MKVPEMDGRSLEEDTGKGCSEFGGIYRKGMLGVWRKVPESDARSLEDGAGKRCWECDVDLVCFRCLTYDHLPAGCQLQKPPNECCSQPVCNGQPITGE